MIIVRLSEEDRQAILLAVAELALARPGWNDMLCQIAKQLEGEAMFDQFKRTSSDKFGLCAHCFKPTMNCDCMPEESQ